jgi:hypothetical protein
MDIKNKLTRQVQIVEPDATDEEVDAVMKSEGGRYQLYKDRISVSWAPPMAMRDSRWARCFLPSSNERMDTNVTYHDRRRFGTRELRSSQSVMD